MQIFNTFSVDSVNDCKLFTGIEPIHKQFADVKEIFKANTVLKIIKFVQ